MERKTKSLRLLAETSFYHNFKSRDRAGREKTGVKKKKGFTDGIEYHRVYIHSPFLLLVIGIRWHSNTEKNGDANKLLNSVNFLSSLKEKKRRNKIKEKFLSQLSETCYIA